MTSTTIIVTATKVHTTEPVAIAMIDQRLACLEANTALSKSPPL